MIGKRELREERFCPICGVEALDGEYLVAGGIGGNQHRCRQRILNAREGSQTLNDLN